MDGEVEDCRHFGLCKCCLQDGSFRSMWVSYQEDDVVQNFGEMLKECFRLNWQKPDNEHLDQICDDCVQLTKTSYAFRQKILASQDQLNGAQGIVKVEVIRVMETEENDGENNTDASIKNETEADPESEYELEYLEEYVNDSDHDTIPDKPDDTDPIYVQDHDYVEDSMEQTDEEVQFLVIDDGNREAGGEDIGTDSTKEDTSSIQRGHTKKPRKGDRGFYKNYTWLDLKKSVEAAKNGLMTPAVAGQYYNVPRKTIAAKLLAEKRGIPPKPITTVRSRYHTFIEEVKTLLTYTNITPFKTKTAHYHCAYCSTMGPEFDDADILRTHTRTQHAGERTKSVEMFLRPLWLNEVLKVDIDNLQCIVCCTVLTSWNDMFKHLKEQHELEFDEAYNRVIPFILKRELHCALCKEAFPNFHHLDGHMNAHYNNYMCSECGDTFLSESRLKKHIKIHRTGRFPCQECGKVYTLEKYRKKHFDLVHKQDRNVRCLYCDEKFLGTYPRHLHVMESHREKVNIITCELCGKTFDWRPYYLVHVRRKHENEKKYKCNFCDAFFFMKSELTRHLTTHTGEKHQCTMCDKYYSTKGSLATHLWHIHRLKLDAKNS